MYEKIYGEVALRRFTDLIKELNRIIRNQVHYVYLGEIIEPGEFECP
jgi:hypothetical protein